MTGDVLPIAKLRAALQRGYYRTIDMFAGCGGFTLGFDRAEFKCISAIEKDDVARSSHELNFSRIAPDDGYCAYSDVTDLNPAEAVRHLGTISPEISRVADVIIGGPPCQAYSRLGRAALWHIEGNDQAHITDTRATLFQYFLQYVDKLKPIAFVLENVPEMGRFAGTNVAEEIAVTADELGYETRYALLNAVWYGVPQLRERMIIIGIHKCFKIVPEFPPITYEYNIPPGYDTSRSSTGKVVVLKPHDYYVSHGVQVQVPLDAVTTAEAFGDLTSITHHLDGRSGKGINRDTAIEIPYSNDGNRYTNQMREWPSFQSNGHFTGHMIRYTPRDYEIFRRMPENAMYPEAIRIAEEIFREKLRDYEERFGVEIDENSPEWHELRKSTIPPYKVDRYPNKFRKMSATEPARTVPAHLGKDTYSHIHYDSEQARGISVREAARLQSFPDAFQFYGSMNAQFTQIGNAVPPLMAYAIAITLSSQLKSAGLRLF